MNRSAAGAITVCTAEDADAEAIAGLCGQLGYSSTIANVTARIAALADHTDQAVLVASDEDGHVVGWVHVCGRHLLVAVPVAEIGGLVVDEAHRGRGIGSALMSAAEAWASSRGYDEVWLRSNVTRAGAHAFYQRIGYQIVKTAVVFRRVLGA